MSQRSAESDGGAGGDRPTGPGLGERPDAGGPLLRTERRRILVVAGVAVSLAAAHVIATHVIGGGEAARPSLVQYALLSGNVLLVFALAFYLFRYLIRLLSERRAGLLGSRFKFKLVATFIGLCIVPAVVLYWMAALAISAAVDRAFAPETTGILSDAEAVSRQFYDDALSDLALEVAEAAAALAPLAGAPAAGWSDGAAGRDELQARLGRQVAGRRITAARLYFQGGDQPLRAGSEGSGPSPLAPADPQAAAEDERSLSAARAGASFVRQRWVEGELHLVAGAPLPGFAPAGEPSPVLVASRRVPADLARRVTRLREGAEEHARRRAQAPWIKAEQALLFLSFSLVIILAATWVSLHVARSITVPIERLVVGTDALRGGDLGHVVEWDGKDELGLLVEGFNDMSRELRAKADTLERQARELREANTALERASDEARQGRDAMATLLQAMSAGVLALDADGVVTTCNRAAAQILELPPDSGPGVALEDLLSPEPLAEIRREIRGFLGRDGARETRDVALLLARGPVHLQAVFTSRTEAGAGRPGALAVFEDVTELVRAQQLAAWEAVARRIAHEIKNPLTPIQLSAQRILKKHREKAPGFDAVLEAGIETITTEVKGLKQMVDEFSRFARMPLVRPVPADANAMLRSVAALYAGHEHLRITLDLAEDLPATVFDADLVRRAVVNLVDNAVEALEGRGHVTLRTSVGHDPLALCIEVKDDGPGVAPGDRERLFLPYFTTKSRGTGLGLAIVHRVAADHHGRVRVADNAPRGARFILELPLTAGAGRRAE